MRRVKREELPNRRIRREEQSLEGKNKQNRKENEEKGRTSRTGEGSVSFNGSPGTLRLFIRDFLWQGV